MDERLYVLNSTSTVQCLVLFHSDIVAEHKHSSKEGGREKVSRWKGDVRGGWKKKDPIEGFVD